MLNSYCFSHGEKIQGVLLKRFSGERNHAELIVISLLTGCRVISVIVLVTRQEFYVCVVIERAYFCLFFYQALRISA